MEAVTLLPRSMSKPASNPPTLLCFQNKTLSSNNNRINFRRPALLKLAKRNGENFAKSSHSELRTTITYTPVAYEKKLPSTETKFISRLLPVGVVCLLCSLNCRTIVSVCVYVCFKVESNSSFHELIILE